MKKKRLVLCFDGTWMNPYRLTGRSNVLMTALSVSPWDNTHQTQQVCFYTVGVGGEARYPGAANYLTSLLSRGLGGGWGAGFESGVADALNFLCMNYCQGDQVFIFGFSRGAAQARSLTHFLDWVGGIPSKIGHYSLPYIYHDYLKNGVRDHFDVKHLTRDAVPLDIQLLGVWDTVLSIGSRFFTRKSTTEKKRAIHVHEKPAKCVRHARQALAIEERRFDFQPEIWLDCHEWQSLEQRWFSGVHGDVGGVYQTNRGLSNVTFHWMLNEAQQLGLTVDKDFLSHHRPFSLDIIHNSNNLVYQSLDAARFEHRNGVRKIQGYPDTANLVIDGSVASRMQADWSALGIFR